MSTLPPGWKIRRELDRIGRKLLRPVPLTISLFTYLFGSLYYDLFLSKHVRQTQGRIALGRKVAIYLIFPTKGLMQSHVQSLEYIIGAGYTPIVISNVPLGNADRDCLIPLCHVFLERPNFGYDFGGYREAIKYLEYRLDRLEKLVILNDSCWFPVQDGPGWIKNAEDLGVDFAAAASNYGVERPDSVDFRNIRWEYGHNHSNFHYCSFALMLSGKLLADPALQVFWRRFPMTNDKTRTVRRGEIGLSQWVIRRGYSHGSTTDISSLDKDLAALTDAELRALLHHLIIPAETTLLALKKTLLGDPLPTRSDILGLILTTVARQGASYSLSDYLITRRGYSFLKKSPLYLEEDASNTSLRLVARLSEPYRSCILREANDLRSSRASRFSLSPEPAALARPRQA